MTLYIEPYSQSLHKFLSGSISENPRVIYTRDTLLKITTSVLSVFIFATTLLIIGIFKIKDFLDSSFDAVNKTISIVLSFHLIVLLAVLDVFTHIKQSMMDYNKIERIGYSKLDELFWNKSSTLKLGDNYQSLIIKDFSDINTSANKTRNVLEDEGGFEIICDDTQLTCQGQDIHADLSNFSAQPSPSPRLRPFRNWFKREIKASPLLPKTEDFEPDISSFDLKHVAGPNIEEENRDDFGIPFYDLSHRAKKKTEREELPFNIERDDLSRENCESCHNDIVKETTSALERKVDISKRDFVLKPGITNDIIFNESNEPLSSSNKSLKPSSKTPTKFKMFLSLNNNTDVANKFSSKATKSAIAPKSPRSSPQNSGINLLTFSNRENIDG